MQEGSSSGPLRQMQSNRQQRRLVVGLSILVVSLMMASAVITIVQVLTLLSPGWNGAYLVLAAFFISIESMVSRFESRRLFFPEARWFLYHITEWVVILLLVRLASYLGLGLDTLSTDLLAWSRSPVEIVGREMVIIIFLSALVWSLSRAFADDVFALNTDERTLQIEQESGVFEYRPGIRDDLVNRILILGIVMVLVASALRIDLVAGWFELPTLRAGVFNLLVYFLLALVLLSLTQYAAMRIQWTVEQAPVQKSIAGRWFLYSAGFIGLVALISAFLPTQYTLGLLATIKVVLGVLSALFGILLAIFSLPILYLMSLLARLRGESQAPVHLPVIINPPAPPPGTTPTPLPWLELLKSLLYWLIFVGVIGFSLYFYLREHKAWIQTLGRVPLLAALGRFLKVLFTWFEGVNHQFLQAVGSGVDRMRHRFAARQAVRSWGYLNLGRMNDRQRVLFYYNALLRRGEDSGWPRQPAQTPDEYSQRLSQALTANDAKPATPESSELVQDVSDLTGKFVEARYSQHEITSHDASLVRRAWEHLRASLRKLRRMEDKKEDGVNG